MSSRMMIEGEAERKIKVFWIQNHSIIKQQRNIKI